MCNTHNLILYRNGEGCKMKQSVLSLKVRSFISTYRHFSFEIKSFCILEIEIKKLSKLEKYNFNKLKVLFEYTRYLIRIWKK